MISAKALLRLVVVAAMLFTSTGAPTAFGWTTPRCGLQVDSDDADIRPLAAVTDGTDAMTIAALLMENGTPRHAFMPQYLLLPYALTRDPPMDYSRPTLDSVGRKLVLSAVEMLTPGLVQQ